jgi:hopene-associated glycosyltransferase HpnB
MAALSYVPVAGTVGIITLGVWLHLFFGRGWFWRVRKLNADQSALETTGEWPGVIAVIPARNEAETIGQVVASLARQNYPGPFAIVIVDDHSEDATVGHARQAANENAAEQKVSIISASALPAGWTGKLWALKEGISNAGVSDNRPSGEALHELPTYYWFTDADIVHSPDTLRRLVARAELEKLDLASLMVLLHAQTLPERALIPAFLYFFLMLYPPRWIADEDLGIAGAAGGCIVLKRQALDRIGGLVAIRGEVIDDCALAKAIKRSSGRVWLALTRKSESLRVYGTWSELRDLIARTAFTQLRYSTLLLAGALAGMLLIYLAPVILLFAADSTARILGAAAWILMTLSFLPTLRFYRLSPLWALFLPLTALFYTYATWLSAIRYWTGKGGSWKGRAQAPKSS